MLSTAIPRDGRVLIAANGAYGERMVQMAGRLGLGHDVLRTPENVPPSAVDVRRRLVEQPGVTHVAMVHCETTTGILNPVEAIGAVARDAGKVFIVDAMSSFGAVPLNLADAGVDFLVSSANKCIEGVPGFSFVLARRESLEACAGRARSLSLDLVEQWQGLETSGQFRFTPPTHALLAFDQALKELAHEGGVAGRAKRYAANHRALLGGMRGLGFQPYLPAEHQGVIITAFHYPADPRFQFEEFYRRLSQRGMIIYPGKLGRVDCFRIGNIGRLFIADIEALLQAVAEVLAEMNVAVPAAPPRSPGWTPPGSEVG